jgi:hypothetical protein
MFCHVDAVADEDEGCWALGRQWQPFEILYVPLVPRVRQPIPTHLQVDEIFWAVEPSGNIQAKRIY